MSKRHTVAEYQDAITKSHGLLSAAARRLGCSRQAIYKAVLRHPTLQTTLDSARDEVLDLAQSRLYQAVDAGSLSAITFLLSTLGRERGFVTRTETVDPGLTARDFAEMSDERLEELAKEYGVN